MIGVLTAETITTSSAELINNLARPRDGIEAVILAIVDDIALFDRRARDSMMYR